MWQTMEPCNQLQEKHDKPRPILGRVTICPPVAKNAVADVAMHDNQQRSHSSLDSGHQDMVSSRCKVARSQSFSHNNSAHMLLPPDPRRFSFTSNESAVSSSSSLSDIWAGTGGGGAGQESVWSADMSLGLYTGQASASHANSPMIDLRRRGSDSECFNIRRQSGDDLVTRRDSDLFAWHEARRRSSGYVSDCSSVSPGPCSTPPSAAPSSSITAVPELTSPGMEYVPIWLKHLRLHKYTDFIMGLSYQELMQITEEKLINLNVTKGARRKILLSIDKLSERPKTLEVLNSNLETDGCDIKEVLLELETIVKSPILIEDDKTETDDDNDEVRSRHVSAPDSGAEVSEDDDGDEKSNEICQPFSGQHIVQMIMKSLRKTTSVILLSQHVDSKHVTLLTQILDICLSRSCFPQSDKQSLSSWRHKILALWGPLSNSQHPGAYKNQTKVKFGFPPQSFKSTFSKHCNPGSFWRNKAKFSPRHEHESLNVPIYAEDYKQYPTFYLQRKSAPNIHSFGNNSTYEKSVALFKKRHSFQEGASFFDNQREFLPGASSVDHFWRGAESYQHHQLSSDLSWSHLNHPEEVDNTVHASMKIFVTCEDDVDDDHDEMNDNLETLCRAVTEQALN